MTMKLLIGYDGSDCAKAAVDDLRRAGLPARAEAVVLTAADVWPPPAEGSPAGAGAPHVPPPVREAWDLAAREIEAAAATAREGADRVRSHFPGWSVAAESCADSPYWALLKRADAWRPDLLVVGSHGRSAAGRLVLGSVSQRAVQHAACSVRVARRHSGLGTGGGAVRVLVGVDGSPESAAAVQAVAMRTWPAGSEATVVAVTDLRMATAVAAVEMFPPTGPWLGALDDGGAGRQVALRQAVDRAADELRAAGLAATGVVREGDPKRVLVADAEAWGADCVFVGAQGLGRLERFLLGSVSSAVAARAPCSVEVVRRG